MFKYLKSFSTHSDYEEYVNSGEMTLPNVSVCMEQDELHYNPIIDYSKVHLTTKALSDGTISFNILSTMNTDKITSISYSTDDGATWTTTENQDNKEENLVINVNVTTGDKVLWKGDATQIGYYGNIGPVIEGSFFSSTAEFDVEGNVMSLCYGDNFDGEDELEYRAQFINLFRGSDVVNAKNFILPSTTLTDFCYSSMFYNCAKLITAPVLPATTLAPDCYNSIFSGCTSLTTAPELPALTVVQHCYDSMFRNCTSLVEAPELPATTLESFGFCYYSMFKNCTNLTKAPSILPAMTLADMCYYEMFRDCTSLETAPVLPATTLINSCYTSMFNGCTSLNYIKAMFTTTPGSFTSNWVKDVAETGTFVKNSAAQWNASGVNAIPSGWTVETASE